MPETRHSALLALDDGSLFRGIGLGTPGAYHGEVVFNTAMTGYVEALTDPSYAGQILTFAYPLIGNYGIAPRWAESAHIYAAGVVVAEACEEPVHRHAELTLDGFLSMHAVGGIARVDTRALVRRVRAAGTVPAVLAVYDDQPCDPVMRVTRRESELVGQGGRGRLVVYDFGVKRSILDSLTRRGMELLVVPADTPAREVLHARPDGIVLSNGPGDPARLGYAVAIAGELLCEDLPVLGICLGHQLLALAMGARTYKLKFGHRGINQPVRQRHTGRVFLTSQNHGYAVDPDSLSRDLEITYTNLNDGTIEGMRHRSRPLVSVQFHPEASPGPRDTAFVFDDFVAALTARG
jgi:carbamoyl-phosphate synthase small subunit